MPNQTAVFLRSGRCHLLALVSPHCSDFYADLLQGIEEEGEKGDYQILVASTFNDIRREGAYLQNLIARRVDGVILLPIDIEQKHLDLLAKNRVPTVFFRRRAGTDVPGKYMTFSDFEGGRLAARHLCQQGCRRVAFCSVPLFQEFDYLRIIHEARLQGYREGLRESGAPWDDSMVYQLDETLHGFCGPLIQAVSEKRVDGIVALSDRLCLPILEAFRSAGIRVPADVKIVGFDNTEMARFANPPLTSVSFPKRDLGPAMVKALLQMMDTGEQDCSEILLQPDLVVRQSSIQG